MEIKKKALKVIKGSGVKYTIFYPSNFMETLGVLTQGKKLMLIGKPQYKNWFIAASDFAGQVVQAMKSPSENSEEYAIQGPEGLTMTEAGEKYISAYQNEKLKLSTLPMGMVRFLGVFVPKFGYGAGIMNIINNYKEEFSAEKTWKDLGEPKTTVEEFARRQ